MRFIGLCLLAALLSFETAHAAVPSGKLIDLGGWSLYMDCKGHGAPTVVVEAGLYDFAIDWQLVQDRVAKHTRICTYDRAGYGFSDAGPMPRTYDQINLDLHMALAAAGEHGPFVLVGHSFGGPVVRNYARRYPAEVAGLVLVDAAQEDDRIVIDGTPMLLRELSPMQPVPPAHVGVAPSTPHDHWAEADPGQLDPLYNNLPKQNRLWRAWAQAQPRVEDAASSERQWSPVYLQTWHEADQAGSLGDLPLMILTRAKGGYDDLGAALAKDLDTERLAHQHALKTLSHKGEQRFIDTGHNMMLSAPDATADAILSIVGKVRHRR